MNRANFVEGNKSHGLQKYAESDVLEVNEGDSEEESELRTKISEYFDGKLDKIEAFGRDRVRSRQVNMVEKDGKVMPIVFAHEMVEVGLVEEGPAIQNVENACKTNDSSRGDKSERQASFVEERFEGEESPEGG